MPEYDRNGFLHGDIDKWIEKTAAKHEVVVTMAQEANRLCHDFLSGRDANARGPTAFVATLLFARMLELFQAVVLLTLRGMTGASPVVFRSFIEAHFHFDALIADPTYLDKYLDNWHVQRLRMAKAIAKTKGEGLEELRSVFTDEKLAELKKLDAESASETMSVREVAELGGNEGTYHTAYALLSNQTHVNSLALERYIEDNAPSSASTIRYGPDDSEVVRQIGLTTLTLLAAYEELAKLFDERIADQKHDLAARAQEMLGVST